MMLIRVHPAPRSNTSLLEVCGFPRSISRSFLLFSLLWSSDGLFIFYAVHKLFAPCVVRGSCRVPVMGYCNCKCLLNYRKLLLQGLHVLYDHFDVMKRVLSDNRWLYVCVCFALDSCLVICMHWLVGAICVFFSKCQWLCKTSLAKVSLSKAVKTLGISNRVYSLLSVTWNESLEIIFNYWCNLTHWWCFQYFESHLPHPNSLMMLAFLACHAVVFIRDFYWSNSTKMCGYFLNSFAHSEIPWRRLLVATPNMCWIIGAVFFGCMRESVDRNDARRMWRKNMHPPVALSRI